MITGILHTSTLPQRHDDNPTRLEMLLASLEKGGSATVIAIDAPRELKHRFNAFGLVKGVTVTVEQRTLAKRTIEVRINHTRLAMRLCEAEKVTVLP